MLTKILTKRRKSSKLDDEEIENIMENSFWNRSQIIDLYSKFVAKYPAGKITRTEFNNIFRSLQWTQHNIQLFYFVFTAIDKNGDGCISFSEALLSYSIIYNCKILERLKETDLNLTSSMKEIEIMIECFYDWVFQKTKKDYNNMFRRFTKFITSNQAFVFITRRHSA